MAFYLGMIQDKFERECFRQSRGLDWDAVRMESLILTAI
ncbi:hypothetical protein LEP1GSC055_3982 [Leptospira borgpetersenii str. Brem 307]|uniref:Transposase n=1 Tax=Leptospira borgpetersenii str. Brem 328 TaxID=1049780 RepID=A0ABC9SNY0_LEPBO|nr:hypothetical protein LEP1GSC055_3982 [Leptospira borgpetersenii str. Brem 307]EMN19380.1 hypothetical protein LEP1GSC056_3044 [Leptospira borgpetersenii str. Brem 328]